MKCLYRVVIFILGSRNWHLGLSSCDIFIFNFSHSFLFAHKPQKCSLISLLKLDHNASRPSSQMYEDSENDEIQFISLFGKWNYGK